MQGTVAGTGKAVRDGANTQGRHVQQPAFAVGGTVDLPEVLVTPGETRSNGQRSGAPAFMYHASEQQFGEILVQPAHLLLLFFQDPVTRLLVGIANTEDIEGYTLLGIEGTEWRVDIDA